MTAATANVGSEIEPNESPAETDILEIVQNWDYESDNSERASAPGVLYLVDSETIREVEGLHALTAHLIDRIMEILEPGQKIVGVAQYYRYREEPPISILHVIEHAVWVVRSDGAHKVRGIHQMTYKERSDWREPHVLIGNYYVHGTNLSYPFMEPSQVSQALH